MSRTIHRFDTIDSTMLEAARLAASGCPSGTVVLADEQTAGQGRHGRRWHSEKGTGLYVSTVLRLPLESADLPVITLALGLAAAQAIGPECDLRWPNDVLIDERKVAGILAQLHGTAVVAGIGVNVNQTSFPEELALTATSLRLARGAEQSRDRLLDRLLDAMDSESGRLVSEGKPSVLHRFAAASSYASGKRVVVDQGPSQIAGITDGLNESGFLYVLQDNGERTLVLAGGLRPAA